MWARLGYVTIREVGDAAYRGTREAARCDSADAVGVCKARRGLRKSRRLRGPSLGDCGRASAYARTDGAASKARTSWSLQVASCADSSTLSWRKLSDRPPL